MPADKVSKSSNRFTPYNLERRPLHAPVGHSGGKVVRQAGAVDLSRFYICKSGVTPMPLLGQCSDRIQASGGFQLETGNSDSNSQCLPPDGYPARNTLCDINGNYFNVNIPPQNQITAETFRQICNEISNTACPTVPPIDVSTTLLPSTSTDLVATNGASPSMSPTAIAGMSVAFPVALAVGITVVAVAAGITTTVIIYKRIRDRIMGSADVTNDVVQWSTTGGTHIVDNRITEEADKVAKALKNSGSSASPEPNNDLDAPQYAVIDGQHITFKNLDSKEETV